MKRIFKKSIILSLILGMFVSTHLPNAQARYIGSLNGIYIYNDSPSYTAYLKKTVWNGWYVVNLSGTTEWSSLRSMLVNSNDSKRSEWNITRGGERDNYYSIGCEAGYQYRLKLYNNNAGSDDIYGSWSPDHY